MTKTSITNTTIAICVGFVIGALIASIFIPAHLVLTALVNQTIGAVWTAFMIYKDTKK